jgi:parallel beta-helix repeat protein
MKLAAWKYFSVIMALVLVLGTGMTALGPTPTAAATAPHQSRHDTDNVTDRPSHHLTGPSDNRTHHSPGFSQYSAPERGYTAGNTWYVNGATGSDTTGTGSAVNPWQTIQHAIDMAASGDTVNIAASYASGDFYNEQLTISKSINLVGEAEAGYFGGTHVEQSGLLVVDITAPGLDVRLSNMSIYSYNWVGQCIRASGDTLTLNNVDFFGDRRIGGDGGGIYADSCTLTLNDCYISGSAGNNGGGIYTDNCTLTLDRCVFWGPSANNNGGGLYAYGSDVNIADCHFVQCVGGSGGAINVNSSNLVAQRCSFDGDWEEMNGDGQGIYVNAVDDNCTVEISNCTFSQNYLYSGDGGAIYVTSQDGYADVTLTCCTFFANEVYGYGGGLYQVGDNSTTMIRNCIFDNWADEGGDSIYVDGGTIDSNFNIYSDIPSGFTPGTDDRSDTDPLCYGMADYGGLTPTCAIDSTSPARHNGTAITGLTEDQRGVTRAAPPDIGAYQWVGPDTYANDLTGSDANSGLSAAAPKKHIYAAANLAGPGSTTHVAAGTYDEENHWDVYDLDYYNIQITKPLTLIGAGAASTIIDGSHPVFENYGPIIDAYDVTEVLDDATVSISGLTLKNATDEDEDNYGGGLAVWDSNATVQNCVIENNYAYDGGGGIYIEDAGEVALIGCTIRNNSANYDGGGIACNADNLTISGCTISGNESTDGYGGGISLSYCYIFALLDSTVSGNSASEDGGGIYGESMYGYDEAQSYDTLMSRCTISSNQADGNGGGIYLDSVDDTDYPVRVEACTLSNNEAAGSGGGLYNYEDSSVLLTNCTIYGNTLPDAAYGGGIDNAGYAELLNCTIASNDAGTTGIGGGYYQEGWGIFENTILANNTAAGGADISGNAGRFTSNGHNICTTDESNDYFNGAGDQVDTDPGLGPLQDNGGLTFTCAIGATSPAYDGTDENAPWFDQRGVARPNNVYWDVGAYEYDGAAPSGPTVTAITPSSGANTGPVSITNLAGTNFVSGATVKLTKSGQTDISGGSVAFVSSTKLTCTFPLTGAATGTWNVVVTNPDAQSGTLTNGFTVTAPAAAPTVSAISPDTGTWGQTLSVTITGTNFTGATAVSFGPGITVTFTVVSSTQINATITIAVGATIGARNISVTTPQGTGTNSFTVNLNPSLTNGPQSHGGSSGSGGGSTGQANQGISPVSMPNIVVQSASVSASKVAPGETVTITANLANRGTVNGTYAVKVYINGQEEAIQGVTVNSGSNRPIYFTLSRNEPGTYTVYVGGTQAGSFTVESSRDSDIILWLSMACVLGALVMGAVMLWRRQRSYY